MTYIIADHILSPLGETTEANYSAIQAYRSALRRYDDYPGIPEPFSAALFSKEQQAEIHIDGLTRFESMAVRSIREALSECKADLTKARVVFILSTTKGNIELLTEDATEERILPGVCAQHIIEASGIEASGIKATPIVVCNACISGLSALILASRLLENNDYDYAIVCGADCQGPFIISGFQSLKALSADACRPFDIERTGMNLGEAAATIILSRKPQTSDDWGIATGCIRNDAYHISAPSKKGEGAFQTLQAVLCNNDSSSLAVVNSHGTATMFNDQMESVAIERSSLTAVPVNSLKGYFGHTMGAAGILETIITMRATDNQTVLGTKGFAEMGVSGSIRLSSDHQSAKGRSFIKMLSGFGGCNAAIWCSHDNRQPDNLPPRRVKEIHHVIVTPDSLIIDGHSRPITSHGSQLLTDIYRQDIGDYPKFYKMDPLSRLGFVASELLLQTEKTEEQETNRSDRAIVFFNRSSSAITDRRYLETISHPEDYFPSPSLFVYTLPNIVTGEIAIRHHYQGETSFYLLPYRDDAVMAQVIQATLADPHTTSIISGWIDYADDQTFVADLTLQAYSQ